jgi:ferric-dicitrate binding protein FerR (iron transport regulator)
MNAEDHLNFLEKYAIGQHSELEHETFRHWLLKAPPEQVRAALNRYDELQRLHLSASPPPESVAALEARLDRLTVQRPSAAPRRWLAAVAASVALLLGMSVYLLRPDSRPPMITYQRQQTGPNQTTRLTLADGSVVHLNGDSRLSYPVTFTGDTREVYLRGEAYFEVTKDAKRPFLIHSGRLQTQVVGTSFNVYAYPQTERLEVTVLTGRVVVSDSVSKQAVTLRPAQRAVFIPITSVLRRESAANPQFSLAWQQGKLRFEQASLTEIIDKLALRYGVRITLGSAPLRQCRLTVEFGRESLTDALEVLTALTGSTYTQDQQHITLIGTGC